MDDLLATALVMAAIVLALVLAGLALAVRRGWPDDDLPATGHDGQRGHDPRGDT